MSQAGGLPKARRLLGNRVGKQVGGLVGWLGGWLGGWVVGSLGRWVAGLLGGWLVGWVVGWLGGWVVGWLGGSVCGWVGKPAARQSVSRSAGLLDSWASRQRASAQWCQPSTAGCQKLKLEIRP